ncbi:MAG: methyltransferase domain-containing protein [Lentisphaeria bacterium]|jgi:malonyl-CoA O-methyltransferase
MQQAIQHSFSAAAASYDHPAGIQPRVAQRLLAEFLPGPAALPASGRILEVGCGTGTLTCELRNRHPGRGILALDLAPGMVARARQRHGDLPGIEFLAADIRAFAPAERFALIASSSALHWIRPLPELFRHLAALLAPGGFLGFAMMTAGTLAELRAARQRVAPHKPAAGSLPRADAALAALRAAGFALQAQAVERHTQPCASGRDLLRGLRAQGIAAGFYGSGASLTRGELARLVHDFDRHHTAITWEVLYVLAGHPGTPAGGST